MRRIEVVAVHVDGRRVRHVIAPAAEAGVYHEYQETPDMTVKRTRRSLEKSLERAATRIENTEQAYHVAAAEVTRLRESTETHRQNGEGIRDALQLLPEASDADVIDRTNALHAILETARRDTRIAEDREQAAHDAAAESARLLDERSHALTAMTGRVDRLEQERDCEHDLVRDWRARAEQATENPRPLTADDITDEMVQRGDQAWSALRNPENTFPRLIVETIIRAALTPPPSRPEGAEKIEAIIADQIGGDVGPATIRDLANRIATEVQP